MTISEVGLSRGCLDHVSAFAWPKKFQLHDSKHQTTMMLSTTRSKGFDKVLTSIPSATIPSFLLPAFPVTSTRCFSSTQNRASQIGRAPLSIPPGVSVEVVPINTKQGAWGIGGAGNTVKVDGPLGRCNWDLRYTRRRGLIELD